MALKEGSIILYRERQANRGNGCLYIILAQQRSFQNNCFHFASLKEKKDNYLN